MEENFVTLEGERITLEPGEDCERMQQVAEYAAKVMAEAGERTPDGEVPGLKAIIMLADRLLMAQEEGTRLRRDMLKVRAHVLTVERENDHLKHEICALKQQLEPDGAEEAEKANAAPEQHAPDWANYSDSGEQQ